jgi:anti-anti-sigma factor
MLQTSSQTSQTDPSPMTVLNQGCLMQMPPLLTMNEAIAFKQEFLTVCQTLPAPTRIVLDFAQTTFVDSSGVGTLVRCQKTAKAQDIELVLWSLTPQVEMVLSLTGLDQIFTIERNTQAIAPPKEGITDEKPVMISTHPSLESKAKRAIDILGALVGLGITGLILGPVAIAIKLDNPGPIFFSQTRCGWMGKQFRIWKFRSMVKNASELQHQVENQAEGAFFKNDNDPRITRVGRFLRRTSLDELPQFWNVLMGEMSLVGTRPPTPEEIEFYEAPEWQRLNVKPGMTGEWQVYGRSKIKSFQEVINLDLRYQRKWTLLYDLQLIFKTIWVIFNKDSGAM